MCGEKYYKYISRESFIMLMFFFNKPNAATMFEELDHKRKQRIPFLQILAILIWTAFSNRDKKLFFAFQVFDFNNDKSISMEELNLFFVSSCKGLARLMALPMPPSETLSKIAETQFVLYDTNNNKLLEISEIENWMDTCSELTLFLERFEPKTKIIERKETFLSMPELNIEEIIVEPLSRAYIGAQNNVQSKSNKIDIRRIEKRKLQFCSEYFYNYNLGDTNNIRKFLLFFPFYYFTLISNNLELMYIL